MGKKLIKVMIVLGKVFTILFSILLISLVVIAINQKKDKAMIDCVNKSTIVLKENPDFEKIETSSLCDLQRIEIKVQENIDIEEMKTIIMNISFELSDYENVEVIIYNDHQYLFARILDYGEFIVIN